MSQPPPPADPLERYTHRAQTVMALAHDRARRLRRDEINTEHLLLAITDAGDSTAAMALAALGIPLDDLRSRTQTHADAGQAVPSKSIPLSAAAGAVLDRARHVADTMGHPYVGTDHLLLALTAQTGSVAAQVLAGVGVTSERLRPEVARLLNAHPRARQTSDEPTSEQVIGGRRFAMPAAISAHNRDIAAARWQKELAIDDQDFEAAAAWRDEEKRLLAAKGDLADTCAAAIGTTGLVDELDRLYRQAERLRELLHRHGIPVDHLEPDQHESAARRERRSPPAVPSATTTAGEHSHEPTAEHRPAVVHPVPSVDAASKPVPVAPQDGVNIRGWLEGDEEHIALVRRHIVATIHEHWYNFGWTFPPRQVNGHSYAFYGAHINTASLGWFADQLREFAALAPDASNQFRGMFAATAPDNATTRWLVRDRQVVTAPGDPAQDHLDT